MAACEVGRNLATGLSGGRVVGGEVHDSNHTVGESTGISGLWEGRSQVQSTVGVTPRGAGIFSRPEGPWGPILSLEVWVSRPDQG